jgi:hypothetical protein
MPWIGKRHEQLVVAVDAPGIVERACTRAADAARILLRGIYWKHGLDLDAVVPPVAEVIDVRELAPLPEAEILQAEPPGVLGRTLRVRILLRVELREVAVADLELIEV